MRREYVWRSLVIAGLLGLLGVIVIVQMVRIQNSPEALIFREQSALYGRKLETFHPERGAIMAPIREQAGTFADSIKLWSAA